jgi:hypothetical protein
MRFFRRAEKEAAPSAEQAVITHLSISGDEFGTEDEREAVYAREARIESAVKAIGGEYDGNELGGGEAVLYAYGPDANALFEAIRACFEDFPLRPGAYAIKRFGAADDPAAREARVPLA